MSGGRPSSIKRIVLCAAASLHIYVPEFSLGEFVMNTEGGEDNV